MTIPTAFYTDFDRSRIFNIDYQYMLCLLTD